ncbi:MAG: isoleucine--tRNA ligase, partial [Paramuribaculum sp.]|nr:isoleucine--tRNA ligase [Paramuribaculum sp.]
VDDVRQLNIDDLNLMVSVALLVRKVKPDFKKLGPKFGKAMKQVAAAITRLDQPTIAQLEREGSVTIDIDGNPAVIDAADVEIISEDIPGWLVSNEGNLTVALDITVTPELRREGIAREIVNRIQNIRKERGYEITDKITLAFAAMPETDEAIREYSSYISKQVLAESLVIKPAEELVDDVRQLNIDDLNLMVSVALC